MKRSGLSRRKPLNPGKGLRRRYGGKRRGWLSSVLYLAVEERDGNGCRVGLSMSPCEGKLDLHHVCTQQRLRRDGHHDRITDPRNLILLCRRHHDQHHNRKEPVPRGLLPGCAHEFASELGLTDWVTRTYPQEEETTNAPSHLSQHDGEPPMVAPSLKSGTGR